MYRFASFTLLSGNIHWDEVKDSQYATIIIKLLFIFFQRNKVIFTMQNLRGAWYPLQCKLAKDNVAVHHATTIWWKQYINLWSSQTFFFWNFNYSGSDIHYANLQRTMISTILPICPCDSPYATRHPPQCHYHHKVTISFFQKNIVILTLQNLPGTW